MKSELTTPKAILIGMSLIAVAIASIPYSKTFITEVRAQEDRPVKVTICDQRGGTCGYGVGSELLVMSY